MQLFEVQPNSNGGIDRLFMLHGDAVSGPVLDVTNADLLPETSGHGRLRLFHFNDLHNHLTELSGEAKGTPRFSQMVQRVRAARAENAPVLFVSIGDDHTGSMLDELMGWNPDAFQLDASYRAYSAGGVDASVLGNHEFDRGSAVLAKGIRQDANFPILSANVHASAHLINGLDYAPAAIAILGGLRVGLLGLTTAVETRVGQESDPTLAVASPVEALQNLLPAMAPLVDVMLIMSHCGYGNGAHQSGKAAGVRDIGEADFALAHVAAELTDKPLLILGAHTHTKLNEHGLEPSNVIHGIPIFQAECNGHYLGEINLDITPGQGADKAITSARLHKTRPQGDYDTEFEATHIAPIMAGVEKALTTEIAHIHTHALSNKSAQQARYSNESALANFICDAICEQLTTRGIPVDLALMNGATLQAGLEPGVLNAGDWFHVMPYADEVFVVDMDAAQIAAMLTSNAKRILRPEERASTDCSGFLARGFLHSSHHIRYRIEMRESAHMARASGIEYLGQPLAGMPARTFKVVMSTYLALGGFGERWNGLPICGGVPGDLAGYDLRALPSQNTGLVYRDEIGHYLRDLGQIGDPLGGYLDGRLNVISKEFEHGSH
jgi:5'-nucleotidase/UDP-sugar diphosphatase